MDRLRAIEYFLKVADLGSFTAAAKATGVPASSISRRIQELEAELGTTLLHRTTRNVSLTELGTVYLDEVRAAVKALDDASDLITERPASPSGLLRITSTPGYGRFSLMPALRKMRRAYPDLVVDIELTDTVYNLAQNEVDIAVRSTADLPERAVARKLTDDVFGLVASPDYLSRYGTPKVLADLKTHRTMLYRGPGRIINWQAKTKDGWVDVQTNPTFICNEGRQLIDEAIDGTGIGLLPCWSIQEELASGALVALTLEDAELSLSRSDTLGIYLLYNQPRYRLNKIKTAVDFLVAELATGDRQA
ncbi:LysR family transcriptional regulator [Pyruvatibacter sp.]|uniref:LysR family transcriptional regulator n=1 Tax=Pyruvatibacter sp. TaxID=1981328 RepID=UPI003263E168